MGNVDKHRSSHESFNRRDWEGAVQHFRTDTTYTDHARGQAVKGPAEFVDYLKTWSASFSDAEIGSPRYIDGGDYTVGLFTGRGTNDGQFGPYPATGKRFELPCCDVAHYDADGKIQSIELFYDTLTLLVQLGHAEPPPA